MLGVDRQHQPVEEPPPLRCRAEKQPVHRRRQPHHAQMIAEGGGGTDRLAVDPAAPAGGGAFAAGRVDAGAERGKAERALDLGGHRPGAVALDIGDIVERGAAQAPSGRQKRDRLDAIGLAGAVRPHQHHHVAARLRDSPRDNCGSASGVRRWMREAVMAEKRRSSSLSPCGRGVAPNEVRRRVRGCYGPASFAKYPPIRRRAVATIRSIVPVTRDPKTFRHQDGVSCGITFGVRVLTAIDFDDDALFEAHEVENESPKGDLPPKLDERESPVAEQSPHRRFSVGRLAAQLSCEPPDAFGGGSMVWCLRHEPLTRRLTS